MLWWQREGFRESGLRFGSLERWQSGQRKIHWNEKTYKLVEMFRLGEQERMGTGSISVELKNECRPNKGEKAHFSKISP